MLNLLGSLFIKSVNGKYTCVKLRTYCVDKLPTKDLQAIKKTLLRNHQVNYDNQTFFTFALKMNCLQDNVKRPVVNMYKKENANRFLHDYN